MYRPRDCLFHEGTVLPISSTICNVTANQCTRGTTNRFSSYTLFYKDCSEIIETITILSKGLNVIQKKLHSHQVLHCIWGLGLNYLTASFNGPGHAKKCLMPYATHPRSLISAVVVSSLDSIISLVSRSEISRF